jgi:hypothetical protein
LNLTNLSGFTVDGASAAVEKREGLIELMQEKATEIRNNSVLQYHCLIYRKNLSDTSLEDENVEQLLLK